MGNPSSKTDLAEVVSAQRPTSLEIGDVYNGFLTQEGNVVWAGAANLAFNDFKQTFLKSEDLTFKQKVSKSLQTLLNTLNHSKFDKTNIKQSAIYVKSGLGNQTVRLINEEMKEKFIWKTTPALKQGAADQDFVSYAYLFKALEYEHQFQRQPGLLWFGKNNSENKSNKPYWVEAFGAVSKQCRDQIKLIEYDDHENFFLAFKAKSLKPKKQGKQAIEAGLKPQPRELSWWEVILNWFFQPKVSLDYNSEDSGDIIYILSSQKQVQTIDKVIEKVMEAEKSKAVDERESNPNISQFIMPVIDLDLKHQYSQLRGLQIQNKELRGRKLKMSENIKLHMDEKGVVVQNDAFIGKDECAIVGNIQIYINKPFWLVLTEQGKHPYLVVKINYLPKKELKQSDEFL